jgi:hypothetical protein
MNLDSKIDIYKYLKQVKYELIQWVKSKLF